MASSNSWLTSLKLVLITSGVVSIAMATKLAVPLMLNFAVYDLPVIWSVFISWLKPPYLYVVINGIIITIAASSRFQHNRHQSQSHPPNAISPSDLTSGLPPVTIQPVVYDSVMVEPPVTIRPSYGGVERTPVVVYGSVTVEPPVVCESKRAVMDMEAVAVSGSEVVRGDENEFVAPRSSWTQPQSIINSPPPKKVQSEFILAVKEKQLVNSRFAHHRKPTKSSPEGVRALRVLKPKKHETMESTWKMITDGRHMPLTRHLRKSDTFGNQNSNESPAKTKVVKKSETFKERTNYENQNDYPNPTSASEGRLRKDGSMSHDELNRRVEAFIKKFNDDMRLQRQESLNQYMEMVNRGAK